MEIERKWMVNGWPEGLPLKEEFAMRQGYISVRPTVLIREEALTGGKTRYVLCFKSGGGLAREEIERDIDPELFNELETKIIGSPLIPKLRRSYLLPDGAVLEVNHVDEGQPTEFWFNQPIQNIYMAATAIMSLFDALDAIDTVKFSGLEASGWYVESAKEAMESGAMTFAGKYSEPDYETLVDGDCDLAIESTMILHTPKVQEMIEDLGIPVFVDYSSYESHPLGRTEWIKLYGALLNKEEEADTFFDQQAHVIEELKGFENTEKTVAYFYVSTDGSIVVRKSDDYIPSMIEIAGGRYAFKDLKNPDSNAPSVKLTMEEFYATAVDADYLIYNGTIDGQVNSISELEAKNELFSEFKAVKDGNVWYTGKNLYQATDTVGELIKDMHLMLTDGDASQMTFLEKME